MRGVQAEALAATLVVVVLLGMAQLSMERSLKHSARPLIKKINEQSSSYLGIIMETSAHEKPLLASGLYVPRSDYPNVTVKGRTFHVGQLNGVDVIYVKTEGGVISTASTSQLFASLFNIEGLIHYGTVGTVNDTLFIGDVVVPIQAAYSGDIQWKQKNSKGTLKFGDYNLPEAGENSLGAITFQPTKLFNASGIAKNIFWLPVDSTWYNFATNLQLQDVELEQCKSSGKCLPRKPTTVYGLRAGSSDTYVQNAALREFVNTQFKISTVDKRTAAVVWVALTNDLPVVVFKGVSNTAGGSTAYSSYSYLGSVNAFNAAAAFVKAIGNASSRLIK